MSLRIQTSSYWDTNGRILAGIGRRGRGGARRDKAEEMCPRRSNECDNDNPRKGFETETARWFNCSKLRSNEEMARELEVRPEIMIMN